MKRCVTAHSLLYVPCLSACVSKEVLTKGAFMRPGPEDEPLMRLPYYIAWQPRFEPPVEGTGNEAPCMSIGRGVKLICNGRKTLAHFRSHQRNSVSALKTRKRGLPLFCVGALRQSLQCLFFFFLFIFLRNPLCTFSSMNCAELSAAGKRRRRYFTREG